MKKYYPIIFSLFLIQACSSSESIFDLSPSQSMSITGKGPGQDAAFNPYSSQNSLGVVKNIGKNNFVIRVQKKGEIIERITINPTESKKVKLLKGYELYLDSELESKAKIKFKKFTP